MIKSIVLLGTWLLSTTYGQIDANKRVDTCVQVCGSAANFPCIGQCVVVYAQEAPQSPIGAIVNDMMVHHSPPPPPQSPPPPQTSVVNPNPVPVSTSTVVVVPNPVQPTTQTQADHSEHNTQAQADHSEHNTPPAAEHSSESHASTSVVAMPAPGPNIDSLVSSIDSRTGTKDTLIPAATGIPNFDSVISSITSGTNRNGGATASGTSTATNTASDTNNSDRYVMLPSGAMGIPVSASTFISVSIPLFLLTSFISLYL